MLIVAILVGILSSAVLGFILANISMATDLNLLSFTVFYILPIGTIIFGLAISIGYFFVLIKGNIKVTFIKSLIITLIAIVAYFGVEYYIYTNTYYDDYGYRNYDKDGYHISEYINPDTDEQFTFWSYYKHGVDHMSISFSSRSTKIATAEGKAVLNWIFEIICIIGLPIGVFAATGCIVVDRKYCDECKKYFTRKKMFALFKNYNFDEDMATLQEIISSGDINNVERLRTFIETHPTLDKYNSDYVLGTVHYCEGCYKINLVLTPYIMNNKKDFNADNKNEKTYTLDKSFYSMLSTIKTK